MTTFHTWNQALGPVPAVDTHYFLAGLIPTVALLTVALVSLVGPWLRDRIPAKWVNLVNWIVAGLIVIMFVFVFWVPTTDVVDMGLQLLAFYLSIFHLTVPKERESDANRSPSGEPVGSPHPRWMGLFVSFLAIVLLAPPGYRFYQQLPQELGGVEPLRVFVEMDAAQVSREMRAEMFGSNADLSGGTWRSDEVELLFTTDEYFLVRSSSEGIAVFRITKGSVSAIVLAEASSLLEN